MLVVKVELWRFGNPDDVEELARMKIANVGGTASLGNYSVRTIRKGTKDQVQRSGSVLDHPRLSDHVWSLVRKALVAVRY